MKTVPATKAKNRLGAILGPAGTYRHPAAGPGHRGRHFNGGLRTPALDLRNEIAREAAANGLTETRIDELLTGDGA